MKKNSSSLESLMAQLDGCVEALVLLDSSDPKAVTALREKLTLTLLHAKDRNQEGVERLCGQAEEMLKGEVTAANLERVGRALEKARRLLSADLSPASETTSHDDDVRGSVDRATDTSAELDQLDLNWLVEPDSGLFRSDMLTETFLVEATEALTDAESCLLALEEQREDPERLNALFRAIHTIKGGAGFVKENDVATLCHQAESLLACAREDGTPLSDAEVELLFEVVDQIGALLEVLQHGDDAKALDVNSREHLCELLLAAAKQRQSLTDKEPQSDAPAEPAPKAAKPFKANRSDTANRIVRVDALQLDRLLDTIGELFITQSRVRQLSTEAGLLDASELAQQLRDLERVSRELQGLSTELRMVPLRATFRKMARLVRDLGKKSGKPVELLTEGEDTEIDKAVVDKLAEPLAHLLRNAVDHGIEQTVKDRLAHGKPAVGQIILRASHRGGNVLIEVSDDGRGLDLEAIRRRAHQLETVNECTFVSREPENLIFEPGLSTAETVTDVSGRGVGLDVVKRTMETLRATIEVDSQVGRGSTFLFRLPQTLAIIDGLIARVGSERYILPTLSVVRSIQPTAEQYNTILNNDEMLLLGDELLPLCRIGELFSVPGSENKATSATVVIVNTDAGHIGVLVDEVVGQQQVVVKGIGASAGELPAIAGATVLPDGHVGLIIEPIGLAKLVHAREIRELNLNRFRS